MADPYSAMSLSPVKRRSEGEDFVPNQDLISPISPGSPFSKPLTQLQLEQMDLATPLMPRFNFGRGLQNGHQISLHQPANYFDIHQILSSSEVESLVYPTSRYQPDYPP